MKTLLILFICSLLSFPQSVSDPNVINGWKNIPSRNIIFNPSLTYSVQGTEYQTFCNKGTIYNNMGLPYGEFWWEKNFSSSNSPFVEMPDTFSVRMRISWVDSTVLGARVTISVVDSNGITHGMFTNQIPDDYCRDWQTIKFCTKDITWPTKNFVSVILIFTLLSYSPDVASKMEIADLIGIKNNEVIVYDSFKCNSVTEVHKQTQNPRGFYLSQNYPNPFNPSTKIKYSIPISGNVNLKVFDVLGKEITTLINENKPSGNHEVMFNSSNLPSGVYFYKLQTSNFTETKKMLLLK